MTNVSSDDTLMRIYRHINGPDALPNSLCDLWMVPVKVAFIYVVIAAVIVVLAVSALNDPNKFSLGTGALLAIAMQMITFLLVIDRSIDLTQRIKSLLCKPISIDGVTAPMEEFHGLDTKYANLIIAPLICIGVALGVIAAEMNGIIHIPQIIDGELTRIHKLGAIAMFGGALAILYFAIAMFDNALKVVQART